MPSRQKYNATKTQIDGITFASKAEAKRYNELKRLEQSGHISALELQPTYQLAPGVKYTGAARACPALRYRADFRYIDHLGVQVVEDVKGMPTEGYRIKKHLLMALHNIEVREVRLR